MSKTKPRLMTTAVTCLAPVLIGAFLSRNEFDWLIGLLLGAGVPYLGWAHLRWLRRSRWAGPIVLSRAGTPLARLRWKGWLLAAFGGLGSIVWYRPDLSPLLAMDSILTAAWFYAVGSAPEFREQGIVFAGKLFRWSEIGSHWWGRHGSFLEVSSRPASDATWIRARLPARSESRQAVEALFEKTGAGSGSGNLRNRGVDATGSGNLADDGGPDGGGGRVGGGEGAAGGMPGEGGTGE